MHCLRYLISVCLLVGFGSPSNAADLEPRLRRPVALAVSSDGQRLFTANRDSGSISVVDIPRQSVVEEVEVGGRLADLGLLDDEHLLAVDQQNHQLVLLTSDAAKWKVASRVDVARDPVRLELDAAAHRCFVTSLWSRAVTMVDLPAADRTAEPRLRVANQLPLSFEPREMCLAQQGARLIVAGSFDGNLAVIDTDGLKLIAAQQIPGHNIRGLAVSSDGRRVLIAQQELNPLARSTRDDVHWGNMVSNLLVSLPLAELCDPQANVLRHRIPILLGEPGRAAGDPGPITVGPAGEIALPFSGVNEVAISNEGNVDQEVRWRRVPVGAGPRSAVRTADNRLFVAEMFADSVSIIDLADAMQTGRISLGPHRELSPAQRGEMLFFDGRLSHDGWMSCHSCHTDGHTNGQLNDNLSDGSFGTPKRVLSLLGVGQTAPWAWNGEMKTLNQQVSKSIQNTMQGPTPTEGQVSALVAYLETLPAPPVLSEIADNTNAAEIQRSEKLFRSLDCQSCHTPPTYTSPQSYDVGLTDSAKNTQFNPPSLRGAGRRLSFFHDGSATSLKDVFTRRKHQLPRELTEAELDALIQFLNSI